MSKRAERLLLIDAALAALSWARTPGNHGGGNPYGLEFVRMAERAVAAVERRPCADWASKGRGIIIHGGE